MTRTRKRSLPSRPPPAQPERATAPAPPERVTHAALAAQTRTLEAAIERAEPGSDARAALVAELEAAARRARTARADGAYVAGVEYGRSGQLHSMWWAWLGEDVVLSPMERLIFLVGTIAGELEEQRGWKTMAASRLNIEGSHITRLLSPEARAEPKAETIDRVRRAIGLRPDFFYDDRPGWRIPQDYLDPAVWSPEGVQWTTDNPRPESPEERGFASQEELIVFHARALLAEVAENGRIDPWRAVQLARAVKKLPLFELAGSVDTRYLDAKHHAEAIQLAALAVRLFAKSQ
jgi:hypothetical protein